VAFQKLSEVDGAIAAKSQALYNIFQEAGPERDLSQVKSIAGGKDAVLAEIRKANEELDALGKERDDLLVLEKAAGRAKQHDEKAAAAGESHDRKPEAKSFADLFVESAAYKNRGKSAELDVEVKTLFERGTGWTPETTRTGRVVDIVTRPLQLLDLVPVGSTSQTSVVYMEETTFTNAAAETAEAGTYAEAALGLTEKSSPVQKIAVFLPVTDEQLEDEAQARSYINRRLPFMIQQRLDSQVAVGNGTAPNLRGYLNVVGIQTQAKGADTGPDAIFKALTKVRVTGRALPGAVAMHSTDWQNIRLLRTADGIYIWGNPSDSAEARIWGLPVAQNEVLTAGTALVGDFANYSELSVRRGIDVKVSDSHGTYFVEGKQAIRADMRAALVVYRPSAFCTVTGL
jgi:HK97 family phage major capsid protein